MDPELYLTGVYVGSSVINSSTTHDIGLKMPLLQFVIDDCCEFFGTRS